MIITMTIPSLYCSKSWFNSSNSILACLVIVGSAFSLLVLVALMRLIASSLSFKVASFFRPGIIDNDDDDYDDGYTDDVGDNREVGT